MIRKLHPLLQLVLCLVLVASLVLQLHQPAYAAPHDADPVKLRVEITDQGFGGKSDDFVIEVEQGSLVELTFVWAHKAFANDEHIFVLEGYKLEAEKIDANHREATIKFVADKLGVFDFHCDTECSSHDYLQLGHLKVKPASSGGASGSVAARIPLNLAVIPSSKLIAAGESVVLRAVLKDDKGAPVQKAVVHFYLDAEFAGTKHAMEIGRGKTDGNGVAFVDYRPTLPGETQKITARVEAFGVYADSEQTFELKQIGDPLPAYRTAPVGLEDIRALAPYGLALVVVGVWATFAFVMFQALSVARVKGRR
jgi:hypothetical protein